MNKIKKLPRAAVWVLAVELLALLWLAAQLARPTADIQLAAADLQPMAELQLRETDGAVTFADGQQEAFAAQAAGDPAAVYWLYGALPRLSAGRYAVTVEYTAPDTPESETALRLVMDTGESVDVGGTCLLPGQKTRFEGHFWLENAAAAPGIELYACAPSVSLVSVAVREVWSWRLVRLLAAAALFAALDGFLWLLRPTGGDADRRTMLLALAGLVFLVSLPCLGGFAVYGTDLHYHMDRVANIAAGLRGGQFPVFIYPDFMNGYGYASPVFYGEALLYLPALLVLAGFPLFTAYNAFNILVNAATVAVCYVCLYKMFRRRVAAFTGTFLYAACNYRLFNLYWRQAAGEITAQIFLPVVLYGFWALYADDAEESQHKMAWLPLMIGFTGLVQSHLLTTEITGLAAVVLVLCCCRRALRRDNLRILLKGAGLTILLNLGFLVPLLQYMRGPYLITDTATVNVHSKTAVNWTMLLDFWSPTNMDTLRLGAGVLLAAGLYLAARVRWPQRVRRADQICLPCLVCAAVCVYLCSSFDWANLDTVLNQTLLHYICAVQFPFRYLVLAAPCLAFAGAGVLVLVRQRAGARAALACAACVLAVALVPACLDVGQYLRGDYGRDRTGEARELDSGKVSSALEYIPTVFDPNSSDSTALVVSEGAQASLQQRSGLTLDLTVRNPTAADASVELPLIYYPGYQVLAASGGLASLTMGANGKATLILAAGFEGSVRVGFRAPLVWRAAEAVSAATLAALLVYALRRRKRRLAVPA